VQRRRNEAEPKIQLRDRPVSDGGWADAHRVSVRAGGGLDDTGVDGGVVSNHATNITLHLRAIYAEGELNETATCKDYLQVCSDGCV